MKLLFAVHLIFAFFSLVVADIRKESAFSKKELAGTTSANLRASQEKADNVAPSFVAEDEDGIGDEDIVAPSFVAEVEDGLADEEFWEVRALLIPKLAWPECVVEPLTCEDCKHHIEEENHPNLNWITFDYELPDGDTNLPYSSERVIIYCVGSSVTDVPTVG